MTKFNIEKYHDKLLFIPLGGCGEIGLNMNLYHLNGKWIMLDCGGGFADKNMPGIDILIPDIRFLISNNIKIEAIILTHAHEDHLGAIPYLWTELKCPVYATEFAANFLKTKLSEFSFEREVKINVVKEGQKITIDPFELEFIGLTHSIPEMKAVNIKTRFGNILHTGDWKLDHDPLVGGVSNEKRLQKLGDEGVLAMVSDSTNIFNSGWSGSEGDLRKSLIKIVSNCDSLVAITTFASNIARVDTVAHVAKATKRKIFLAGFSLGRLVKVAQKSGYLQDAEFLDSQEVQGIPRNKILVLCTGCQGEEMAAMSKMANNTHPFIKLKSSDTIIFSSKIIPGNEKKIFTLFNKFAERDIEIMTEKDHFVHVSGHPNRDEVARMYELVRPKIAIPVHGELVHIKEHASFALKQGVSKSIRPKNGDIISIDENHAEKVDSVYADYLGVDGNYLQADDSNAMKERRKMRDAGVIVCLVIVNKNNRLVFQPKIEGYGLFEYSRDKDFIRHLQNIIAKDVESRLSDKAKISVQDLENSIRRIIKERVKDEFAKEPLIDVILEKV